MKESHFPSSGPMWDEAWGALRHDMEHKVKMVPVGTFDNRMESKVLVGEAWMYDGLFLTSAVCHLTGIACKGWFHNFRHRGVDQNGGLRMVRYYLARILPEQEPPTIQDLIALTSIVPSVHELEEDQSQRGPVKYKDDGKAF